MAVTPKLEIKQSQSLLMTPQLRQAISLLQLNNIELAELVAKELEQNPFLEKEDDRLASAETHEQTIDDYNQLNENTDEEQFAEDIDYNSTFDDSGSDCAGYEPSWTDFATGNKKSSYADDDFNYLEQRASKEESVYDLLNRQINTSFQAPKDKLTAARMVSFLDGAGYFTGNLNTLAQQLHLPLEYLKTILKTLQTFEPSGIFATSLKECLSIQLADKNRLDEMMQCLLDNLDILAAGDIKKLKKLCQADDEDMASMLSDIKSLDPKPLAKYHLEQNAYIIPDVYVRRSKYGDYFIELNQDTLPRILINQEYKTQILNTSRHKAEKKYIKDNLSHANFLIRALHQRAETILRISEEIVKHQHDFFENGISGLKPMLLRDIAQAAELHESTVSRTVNHKYMHTPFGTFELKYFFSTAAGMYNGDTQTSVTEIKHKIKNLIENETDKILSDDALVEILAQQSIKIARRTIAKYRDEMKIPTSAERKRQKRKSVF